jgi:hypothetical protein
MHPINLREIEMKNILMILALSIATSQVNAEAFAIEPFAGDTGYQEIKLSDNSWYVAYFGSRKTAMTDVEMSWRVRAARLCEIQNSPYFVELNYVAEPVLTGDKLSSTGPENFSAGYRKVGAIFVPIYTPPVSLDPEIVPTKMAPILCLAAPTALRAPERVQEVSSILAQARKNGYTFN